MAIFGNKKNKAVKETNIRKHRARTTAITNGIENEIIRAPWFSEKALIATEKGVYAFEVSQRATKADIAGVSRRFTVGRKIRTINVKGKPKAMRTKRGTGMRSARRKAYVYLNAGDTIQFA